MPVWVWGWLEAFGFLQMVPWLDASNLEQLDLGLQAGLVQTRRMPVWVWGWLEAFRFFRWCPDWMLPILNNDLVWAWKLVMRIPDLKQAVSGPYPVRARNGQIWPEFLQLCCRPRKVKPLEAPFKRKRAVSGPSALLGSEIDGPGSFLKGNGPSLAHLPFWGPKCPEFLLLCCRPRKGRF